MPRKGAFAIWVAIFRDSSGQRVDARRRPRRRGSRSGLAMLGRVGRGGTARAFRVAVALLLGAAAAAWAHAALAPVWPTPCAPRFLAIEAGGLYAGWLSLASALGLAIAWPHIFDRPETV